MKKEHNLAGMALIFHTTGTLWHWCWHIKAPESHGILVLVCLQRWQTMLRWHKDSDVLTLLVIHPYICQNRHAFLWCPWPVYNDQNEKWWPSWISQNPPGGFPGTFSMLFLTLFLTGPESFSLLLFCSRYNPYAPGLLGLPHMQWKQKLSKWVKT